MGSGRSVRRIPKIWTLHTIHRYQSSDMKKKQLDAIAQRWATALADFSFVIEYKSGRANVKADALSRLYDAERQQDNKWRDWALLRTTGFHDEDEDEDEDEEK